MTATAPAIFGAEENIMSIKQTATTTMTATEGLPTCCQYDCPDSCATTSATGKGIAWVLTPGNWNALPDSERANLADQGCSPFQPFDLFGDDFVLEDDCCDYGTREMSVGVWFGLLVLNAREWGDIVGAHWLTKVPKKHAAYDFGQMTVAFQFDLSLMEQLANWVVVEALTAFRDTLGSDEQMRWLMASNFNLDEAGCL